MGKTIELEAEDGHRFDAYHAEPEKAARGGVLVLQEIFGVNTHIRSVCDRYAREGYSVLAPALYDRSTQRGCDLGYNSEDVALGRQLREEFSWDDTVKDVKCCAEVLANDGLAVGTVGFCWGGTISFLAATRLGINAAVVYYGGQIMPYVDEVAASPLLMHFGDRDASIPMADVDTIRRKHPTATVHVYSADHGFNCDMRGSYDAQAAKKANERTLAFFAKYLD